MYRISYVTVRFGQQSGNKNAKIMYEMYISRCSKNVKLASLDVCIVTDYLPEEKKKSRINPLPMRDFGGAGGI